MTRAAVVLHSVVAYPHARSVGCCCGWFTTNVDPENMDETYANHLTAVGGW